ncbi:MAG: esterase-like activity of phytase family protein [Rubrobacteraceae bacterium]
MRLEEETIIQDQNSGNILRPLIVVLAALLALCASTFAGAGAGVAVPTQTKAPECATGVDFLGFSDALNKQTYEGTSVGGLSALTYDQRLGVYYSLVDNGPTATSEARFYTLRLPTKGGTLGEPEVLDVTTLRDAGGQPFTASDFDGEGLTLTRSGDLFASSETEPSIRRFSLDGALLEELPVPPKFRVAPEGQATPNQTFESLSLSPNNRSLFTAVEGPLAPDGQTTDGENRIRILRYEDRGSDGFVPIEEFFYLTEPGQGVVEIVALSESELLVLERGFVAGEGNTVRVFRVSLEGAEDVSDEPSLATPGLEPVEKELLVDLADCPPGGATTPGTQENPLLDNYESLALGPRLPGGRRPLLLQSDDNFSAGQVTRVVALGVDNEQLRTRR